MPRARPEGDAPDLVGAQQDGIRQVLRCAEEHAFCGSQTLTTVPQGIQFELMSAIQFAPREADEDSRTAPRKFLRDEILRALSQSCEDARREHPRGAKHSPRIRVVQTHHNADVGIGSDAPSSSRRHDAQVNISTPHCRPTRRAGIDTRGAAYGSPRLASCRSGARARPTRGEAMVRKGDQDKRRTRLIKAVGFVP
jgi:hypothetical protein